MKYKKNKLKTKIKEFEIKIIISEYFKLLLIIFIIIS